MKGEDREPIRVAPLGDHQRPPIGHRHRLRARCRSHDGIIMHRGHGGKLLLTGDIPEDNAGQANRLVILAGSGT
jgi:hypothetical protein